MGVLIGRGSMLYFPCIRVECWEVERFPHMRAEGSGVAGAVSLFGFVRGSNPARLGEKNLARF